MTRARTLADMISDGVIGTTELADDAITPVKLDETGSYAMASLTVADADNGLLVLDETNGVAGGAQSTYISLRAGGSQTAYMGVASSGGIMYTANKYGPIQFMTGPSGTEFSRFILEDTNQAVFNEIGANYDFRVESDGNTHMLFVDASENAVAIGSASTSTASRLRASTSAVSSGNSIVLIDSANDANVAGNHLRISSARGDTSAYNLLTIDNVAGEILNISGNGSVVFNEAGADRDFRVESDSRSNALVLDGGTGGLALNTTNSDFYTGFDTTSIKLGPVASMWSLSNGSSDRRMTIDQNLYVNTDGTNRYLTTGAAARYQMNTGSHRFETAPSGSDDATASDLAVQMLIENDGEVRMLPSNTDAQNLKFRTTSTAGRSVIKALTREDSGSVNPMSQLQLMAYGTNSYLGQFKVVLNSSDTYNSTNQNNVADFKGTGGLVLNESGLSYLDFRVESDNDTHALFVDASTNRVGVSTSAPPVQFTVGGGDGTAELMLWGNNTNSTSSRLIFGAQDPYTSEYIQFRYNSDSNLLQLETDTGFGVGKIVQFDRQYGRVTFNEDSAADADFRVESNNYANMLSVDASLDLVQVVNARLQFEYDTDPTVDTIRETVVNGKTYRGSYGQGYNTLWAKSLYTTISTANRTFPILSVDRHGGNNRVWVKVTMRAAGAVANQGNEAVGYALINADGGDASRTYTSSVTVYGALNTYAATFTLGWNTSADPDVLEVTTIKNANYVALSFDIEVIQQDGNAPVKFLFSTYG